MTPQGLSQAERIRRRPDFERVYASGARLVGRYLTVFRLANNLSTSRLGVAATRKLGNAVERNRAKRLAREIFRRHKPLGGHDVVIVPRRGMLDAPFPHLEADFHDTLLRQHRLADPQTPRGHGGGRSVRHKGL